MNIFRSSLSVIARRSLVVHFNTRVMSTSNCAENCQKVKIVFISDTHSRHEKLGDLPPGDILIHAGTKYKDNDFE